MVINAAANKISIHDHPYDQKTYLAIDKLAKRLLGEQVERLSRFGFMVEMAPEIEATTDISKQSCLLDNLNEIKQESYLPRFKALWQEAEDEVVGGMIELLFDRTSPINFVNAIRDFKLYAKKVARDLKANLSFFDKHDSGVYPSMHINFSLWEGHQNLFAQTQDPIRRETLPLSRLATFVINRFMRDLAENIFLFTSGKLSLIRMIYNGGYNKFFSWGTVTKDSKLTSSAKASPNSLLIRDIDDAIDYPRAELRFSDASGLDSLKTLLIVRSIADSIDYLITKYSHAVQSRKPTETVADVIEECMELEKDDHEIMHNSSTGDYYRNDRDSGRIAYFFLKDKISLPDDTDQASMMIPLEIFSNSPRAKEMLTSKLHAMSKDVTI